MKRSEQIGRILAPDASALHFETSTGEAWRDGHVAQYLWLVNCIDQNGTYVGGLQWDADTGDLVRASRPAPVWPAQGPSCLNRTEAVLAVRDWLLNPAVNRGGSRWKLAGNPERRPQTWRLYCVAPDAEAAITVDAQTGAILDALVEQPDSGAHDARRIARLTRDKHRSPAAGYTWRHRRANPPPRSGSSQEIDRHAIRDTGSPRRAVA